MIAELAGTLHPDPALRGVERLLLPEGPHRFLKELRAVLPVGEAVRLTVVKQRLGQRAVLKIEALPPGPAGCWFAKFVRSDRPAARASVERIAAEARELGIGVPTPVAWLGRSRALVTEGLPGCPPLRRPEGAIPALVEVFRQTGTLLACLHAALPVPAKEGGRAVEIERVRALRDGFARRRPVLLGFFDRKLAAWADAGRTESPRVPPGTALSLHGDFYPEQVLVADGAPGLPLRYGFLDWDENCRGEAERDVGNFAAHLTLKSLQGHLTDARAEVLGQAFRFGYEERQPLDQARLNWYVRGTLLRLAALYADPAFGAEPPNAPWLASFLLERV